MRRPLAWFSAFLLSLGFLFGLVIPTVPAEAAPPTAPWTGAAGGDVLNADVDAVGLDLVGARLAISQSNASSTATPRTSSASSNIGADVAGILGVAVETNSQIAPPDQGGAVTGSLLDVNALGLVRLDTLTTRNEAHWSGNNACVTGNPLADSRVQTLGARITPLTLVSTGVSRTTGASELVSTGGAGFNRGVRSEAAGQIAPVSLLSGGVVVSVEGESTLTARADGTTGSGVVSYNPGLVRVKIGTAAPVVVNVGATVVADLGAVGRVDVRVNPLTTQSVAGNGTASSGSVAVVTLTIRVGTALAPLATGTVNLLPLRASATIPSGGIDCPPPPPVVVAPADNATVNTTTPTYSGTGQPGSTINLTVDGTTATNVATVSAGGTWSYTPTTGIGQGAHTVSATQTLNGTTSTVSNTNNFTVDSIAPTAPTLVNPPTGTITSNQRPVFTGTAEPNATVRVFVDGNQIGTTTANGSGAFSFTPATNIAEGPHTAFVRAVDAAGNVSPNSNTNSFTIDTTPPAAPVVVTPANNSATDDDTPLISGTAVANTSVRVFVDGTLRGTTTSDGTGAWQLTSPALADGTHTTYAIARDAAGNDSAQSNTNTFRVDTQDPAPPVITAPANGARLNDNTPTITGTGEVGATVNVSLNGTAVGTATVNGAGNWTFTTGVLADGPYTVAVTQTDAAGNTSGADSIAIVIDTVAAAPVITAPAANATLPGPNVTVSGTGEAGASLTLTDDDGNTYGPVTVATGGGWSVVMPNLADGTYTVTAVQTDVAGNVSPPSAPRTFTVDGPPVAPVINAPANNSTSNDTTPTIAGTGEAGADVTLTLDNGTTYGPIPVAAGGTWTFTTPALADGTYNVTATQTDGNGQTSPPSNAVTFTVDTATPAAPVVVGPANGSVTNDATPPITGTAEANSRVQVFVDGTAIGTVTANGAGNWSLTPVAALGQGPHTVYAVATDAAGNPSPQSNTNTFTVDSQAAPPVITAPGDGDLINDPTPDVTGTAEPNATVTISVDGTPVGTTTANGTGGWTFTIPAPLADGPHTIAATQTDAAGNTSAPAEVDIVVDATPPAAPIITDPDDGDALADTTPLVTGTGTPGLTVTVSVDGAPVGTAVVGGGGGWSVQTVVALSPGAHTITAIQTDAAGNDSAPDTVNVTVDTTPPAAPVIQLPTEGAVLQGPNVTVSGTGEAGAAVVVTDQDGNDYGPVTVTAGNTWSVAVPGLADGPYTVTAVQTDPAGNPSPASAPRSFVVDSDAPDAPVITVPANNSATNDTTPTIAGTGEAGSSVTVTFAGGLTLGPVPVGAGGGWSITSPVLADGTYTITATQTDGGGNPSAQSAPVTFRVDTVASPAPVVVDPPNNSVTRDNTPAIGGTAEAGTTVRVILDGALLGSTLATGGGIWSFTPSALPDNTYQVYAVADDGVNGPSGPSNTNTFTVDTVVAPPTITAPDDGDLLNDATPDVTGGGEPNATVTVSVDGVPVGTAPVSAGGSWTFTLPPQAGGEHDISVRQTDQAGNVSAATEITVTIDATAPARPVILSPLPGAVVPGPNVTVSGTGEAGATLVLTDQNGDDYGPVTVSNLGGWTVVMPGLVDGAYTVTAVQTDAAGNASLPSLPRSFSVNAPPLAPVITAPADNATTNDPTPTIAGTGQPLATVNLSIDANLPVTVLVDLGGNWTYTPLAPLNDGVHTVEATQTDTGGTSPADSVSFTVDATAPVAPVVLTPANGSRTNDTTPAVTGTTLPGTGVRVFVDGVEAGAATVTAAAWTYTVATPLAEGSHTVYAVATDAAGNVSIASNTNTFVVDVAPAAPVITAPPNGSTTADTTPTIEGTGQALATITLRIDGVLVPAVVTVGGGGNWSYTPAVALGEGSHTVTATQTDLGGTSAAASTTFTIDAAPPAPTITSPTDGSTITDATPVIAGTGQPGATLNLTVNGLPVLPITVPASGNWTYEPPLLPQGSNTVVATQTDAGGTSGSATVTFTVDSIAPLPPLVLVPVNGSTIADQTPDLSGTTDPGTTVTVFIDGTSRGPATVSLGTWTFTSASLALGSHTAYVVAADAAGNTAQSNTTTFTIDLPPAAPTISAPPDGSTTSDTTPTISGTGQAGATINLSLNGVPVVDTITVTGGGTWSYTPLLPIPDATYTVVATQTDPGGTSGSATVTFTIDATAPLTPVVLLPANGSTTSDSTPTISGTTEPGTAVTVLLDGTPYPAVVTVATFSVTAPELSAGTHTVYAIATDAAGNTAQSNTNTFTIDLPPAAPTITAPANGSTVTDSTPEITGTGQAGATLNLTLNGVPAVGVITVAGDGNWSYTPTVPLLQGSNTAVATQTDPGGTSGPVSVTFTIDSIAPVPPVVLVPANGSATDDTTPTISGTTELGTTVRVFIDGTDRGPATVSGVTWTFTSPLALGDHTVYAVAADAAGNTAQSNTNTFTIAPPAPAVTSPANGSATNDTTPTISGTGVPGATINLTIDGTPVAGPIVVAANGTWSYDVPTALDPGDHTVVATQTVSGATSAASTVTFDVDTAVPDPPVITAPDDGDTVGDLPTISGTAEPNSTVTVIVDGQPVGTTTADDQGDWTFTPEDPLAPGEHVVTATQTDEAGNVSEPSEPITVTVPEIDSPVIVDPAEGAVLTDTTPTVTGTAEPGSAISLRHAADSTRVGARARAGELIGTATADAEGSWSVTFDDALDPGSYAVVATQVVDGYENRTSNVRRFVIPADDGITPPVITTPQPGDDVDSPFQVCGTGQPGAAIQILDQNGAVIGSTTVLADGTFCVEVSVSDGTYTIRAVQTVGDATQTSPTVRFTVDSGGGGGGNGGGGNGGGSGSGSSGSLPDTGGPSLIALVGALALLLAGAGAFVLARRRP